MHNLLIFAYICEKSVRKMRLCDLKEKEIINVCTCKSLGCPVDLEFDQKTGCLQALVVASPGRFCGFFNRENEYVIPWNCICQIGEDIILVEMNEEHCRRKKEPDSLL